MKILILANFGMGLYKFRKELILELIDKNFDVIICYPKDEYSEKIKQLGCEFIDVGLDRRGMNPYKDFKLLKQYRKIIQNTEPDIVLTYTIKPNVYGGLACQLENIPYLTNITGLGTSIESNSFISKIIRKMYKIGIKKSNHVYFQNNSNLDYFKSFNILKSNFTVLPGSGINLDEFEYSPVDIGNKYNLLYIGRIMKDKGIDELILAAQDLIPKYNNLSIDIVGFDEESYDSVLKDLNKKRIINYHGKQKDVVPYIKNSTAIIQPSYHEGLSNVLLEGAAIGRPLLASNIPGCKEVVDHDINGYLFEPGNVGSLKNIIIKFLKLNNESIKIMGKNSRNKVEKEFDRSIVVKEYMKQIEKITGGKTNGK